MRQRGEKAGGRDNRGMALVLTLLVVAILTAMVVEFAYGVYISTNALHNWQAAQQLSLAAKSATRLGARLITENASLYPYTYPGHMEITQKIPFDEIDGTISLRIEDENSKFNLNTLVYQNRILNTNAYASLLRMLKALDLKKDIADRIIDWIDPDTEPRLHDSENSAKNGYLDSIEELLLIPGIDRESYEKLLPCITIYGAAQDGTSKININGAAVPVLMSLSDSISKDMAESIIRYRDSTPFEKEDDILKVSGFDNIGTPLLGYIAVKAKAFHVLATAQTGNIKRVIESVIDISGSSRAVRYWKEF
jgi:general secretion pathway protein K